MLFVNTIKSSSSIPIYLDTVYFHIRMPTLFFYKSLRKNKKRELVCIGRVIKVWYATLFPTRQPIPKAHIRIRPLSLTKNCYFYCVLNVFKAEENLNVNKDHVWPGRSLSRRALMGSTDQQLLFYAFSHVNQEIQFQF